MRHDVKIEDLAEVSYLNCPSFDGRLIPLQPCFNDQDEWELWMPSNDGLTRMRGGQPVESTYFAKQAVEKFDLYFEFINFFMKRAYYPDVAPFIGGVLDDIFNLGTSLDKLNLAYNCWKNNKESVTRRFVSTELEYIFKVSRSVYDLLQEMAAKMWAKIQLIDPNQEKKEIKKSFAKMIISGETLLDQDEIAAKYKIPSDLAGFYHRQGEFFQWLRQYRNYIAHSGKSFELVFLTEKGFAISIDKIPFSTIDIWSDANTQKNGLGSVRSIAAHIILKTLGSLAGC